MKQVLITRYLISGLWICCDILYPLYSTRTTITPRYTSNNNSNHTRENMQCANVTISARNCVCEALSSRMEWYAPTKGKRQRLDPAVVARTRVSRGITWNTQQHPKNCKSLPNSSMTDIV
eukprot:581772_1